MSITDDPSVGRRVGTNTERKHATPDQAVGAVITELRLRRNWSHADMAERVGYSDKHINSVEMGQKSPTHRMLVATAQLFGLRPSQLLARAEKLYLKHQEAKKR
ncbi:MAG TPA: helix-turn-helix transcriptional regulator [Candidatus Angelobacter sp.]|nr:helix-turn-helix transcriptional regulator [Candidatus Angelobacter sp.]